MHLFLEESYALCHTLWLQKLKAIHKQKIRQKQLQQLQSLYEKEQEKVRKLQFYLVHEKMKLRLLYDEERNKVQALQESLVQEKIRYEELWSLYEDKVQKLQDDLEQEKIRQEELQSMYEEEKQQTRAARLKDCGIIKVEFACPHRT